MKRLNVGKNIGISEDSKAESAIERESRSIQLLPLAAITVVSNVRKEYSEEAIAELAESIKEYGLLQPIVVNEVDGRYHLIFGHRRYYAAQKAGLDLIQALVRQEIKDINSVQLIENIQRENLSPIDLECAVYDMYSAQNSLEAVGKLLGKSKSWVAYIVHAYCIRQKLDTETAVLAAALTYTDLRKVDPNLPVEATKCAVMDVLDNKPSSGKAEKCATDTDNAPKKVPPLITLKIIMPESGELNLKCNKPIPEKAQLLINEALDIIKRELSI